MNTSLIYVQLPEKPCTAVLKVIEDEIKEEKRYNLATGSLTNFRLLAYEKLLNKIKSVI